MNILKARALLHGYETEMKNLNNSIEKHYKDIEILNIRKFQMEGAIFAANSIVNEMQKAIDEEEKAKAEAAVNSIDEIINDTQEDLDQNN